MKKIFTKLKSILNYLLSFLFGFRLRFTIYRLKEEKKIMISLSLDRKRKDVMQHDSKSNSVSTNERNEET